MKYTFTAALVGALVSSARAHTWIEQLMIIAPNGTFSGQPGYARSYVQRSAPGFNDELMSFRIPPTGERVINDIRADDNICHPSQRAQIQSAGSPRLQAPAGAMVALRYLDNGHVTLPSDPTNTQGKPDNRGTVYVYGTSDPKPDDALLSIHRQWTPDGQGGDKRGVLLATRNYDDGQCYEKNGSPISVARQAKFSFVPQAPMGGNLWCQSDIQIPTTAPSGKPYTLYWVWDWPTLPGTQGFPDGKQELYTTCMDVDIIATGTSGGNSKANAYTNVGAAAKFIRGQNVADAAIPDQFANIANPTLVTGKFIPFKAVASGPASGSSSGATSGAVSSGAATPTTAPGSASAGNAIPTVGPSGAVGLSTGKPSNGVSTSTTVVSSTAAVGTSTIPSNPATPAVPNPSTSQAARQSRRPAVSAISPPVKPSAGQNTATAVSNGQAPVTVTAGGVPATVTRVSTLISYLIQTQIETVTAAPISVGAVKRKVQVSTDQPAYRLRARNAFAVVAGNNK